MQNHKELARKLREGALAANLSESMKQMVFEAATALEGRTPKTRITNCQVYPVREPMGKLKAYARIVLDDEVQWTKLRVYEGTHGLFVSYPNDPETKGEDYRQLYYPLTRELRNHVEQVVLAEYGKLL